MAIDRYSGLFTPICDVCGEELPGEFNFEDAKQAMKDTGWKTQKNEFDEWENVCPACQRGET